MTDHEKPILIPALDLERLALYRTLLAELRQANADMNAGSYRIFRQPADSTEMLDVTPEAIRTNQVSIVLLEAAIALEEVRRV